MKNYFPRLVPLLAITLGVSGTSFASAAQALNYFAPIEQSAWYASSSIFECSIIHDVPSYGQGVFYHEAGEQLYFYSQTNSNPMQAGKAALVIEASPWRPGHRVENAGYVSVADNDRPLSVERKRARLMIDGLLNGMMPTFTRKAWFSDESVRLSLNSVGFAEAYKDYLSCIASLLPVNFRQIEKSRVHFESDKSILLPSDKARLDLIVLYVRADASVTAIYVDGHTDSTGRRIYNRRLSKMRAEEVTRYLESKGVNADIIQTRYHGERYPVAGNRVAKDKAQNRRSTVRLVRGESLSMPTKDAPEGELN